MCNALSRAGSKTGEPRSSGQELTERSLSWDGWREELRNERDGTDMKVGVRRFTNCWRQRVTNFIGYTIDYIGKQFPFLQGTIPFAKHMGF